MPDKQPQHKRFSGILGRWDDDKLFAADRAIQDLREHPGWQILEGLLQEGIEVNQRLMVFGDKTERHDFTRYAGLIEGLGMSLAAVEAIPIYARERQAKLEKEIPGGNP